MSIKPLTTEEREQVGKVLPRDLMAQYGEVENYGEVVDRRSPEEKALNHATTFVKHTPAFKLYLEFKSDVENEMERVMNDPALLPEQRRAVLSAFIDEKADEYVQQINDTVAEHKGRISEVRDYLARAVSETDRLTPAEIRENEFVHREMSGEIQTAMYTAFELSQVLAIFNKQMDMAQHNKARARFLHKNAYLFMQRAEQLAEDDIKRNRAITEIQKGVNRIEKNAYDPAHLAVKKMYENAKRVDRPERGAVRSVRMNQKAFKQSL